MKRGQAVALVCATVGSAGCATVGDAATLLTGGTCELQAGACYESRSRGCEAELRQCEVLAEHASERRDAKRDGYEAFLRERDASEGTLPPGPAPEPPEER